jgi:hypothetical protein
MPGTRPGMTTEIDAAEVENSLVGSASTTRPSAVQISIFKQQACFIGPLCHWRWACAFSFLSPSK